MMDLDDQRWKSLCGGYGTPFDPRPLFRQIESETKVQDAWQELWGELYHQGDIGELSYAAVPHLVRIYAQQKIVDWNTYAIVAVIESARNHGNNPSLPEWLSDEYFAAIRTLAELGIDQIKQTEDPEMIRAILSILALAKGLQAYSALLIKYSEAEILELVSFE